MRRAAYFTESIGPFILAVTDLNDDKSVTNDIDNIIEDLTTQGHDFDRKRLIYCDSDGRWDGVAVVDGKFARFVPLGHKDKRQAAQAALNSFDW